MQTANLIFQEFGDTLKVTKSRHLCYVKSSQGFPTLKAANPRFLDQIKYLITMHTEKRDEHHYH